MKKILLVVFMALCFQLNAPLMANDTAISGLGDNVGPFEGTPEIVLDNEVINLEVHPDKTYVDIAFSLRNEGPTQTILVGFPDEYASYEVPGQEEYAMTPYVGPVMGFKVTVNGHAVAVQEKKQVQQKIVGDYPPNFKVVWHVWPVTFAAGKTTVIGNKYYVENGINVLGEKNFHYTLVTGAKWKGNIGKTTVNITFTGGLKTSDLIKDQSESGIKIISPTKAVWVMENFEPAQDSDSGYFHIVFKKSLTNEIRTRNLTEQDLQGLTDRELKILRNEIYARHGRAFKTPSLSAHFSSYDWYKINPKYSDSQLNSFEKRNAQFILNYEKKIGSKIIYTD